MATQKKRASAPPKKSAGKKSTKGLPVDVRILDYLTGEAKAARENAHAPYSKYKVGAAILTRKGRVYKGCNFENASYGACICAERGAIGTMCAQGDRDPIACVVVTRGETPAAPCGICRQVLAEFAGDDLTILLVGLSEKGEKRIATTLGALLPHAFRDGALKKR